MFKPRTNSLKSWLSKLEKGLLKILFDKPTLLNSLSPLSYLAYCSPDPVV